MSDSKKPNEYPLYEMRIDGKLAWCSLAEAGVLYDSGIFKVEPGRLMIDSPGALPRDIPDKPAFERQLRDLADKASSSK